MQCSEEKISICARVEQGFIVMAIEGISSYYSLLPFVFDIIFDFVFDFIFDIIFDFIFAFILPSCTRPVLSLSRKYHFLHLSTVEIPYCRHRE